MYSRSKNTKNQFIGRRTGQNVLPGKTVRKREDGTDVFQDYWTDSEGETTDMICSLFKPSVVEKEEPDSDELQTNKDVMYKTVVTDVLEIQTEEVIYSSKDFAIQCQNSFNKTITIHHSEERNEDGSLDAIPLQLNLNETHTIQNESILKGIDDASQDNLCLPKNIMSENSTNVDNNISLSDVSSCQRKSATFNQKDTPVVKQSLELSLRNGELDQVVSEDLNELNQTNKLLNRSKRKAPPLESDANKSLNNSSESKENDISKVLTPKNNSRVKAVAKKKSRKKNKTQKGDAPHEKQTFPDEQADDIPQDILDDIVLESISEDVREKEQQPDSAEETQQNLQKIENNTPKSLKGSSKFNKDISQILRESKKKKSKKGVADQEPKAINNNNQKKKAKVVEDSSNCRRSTRQRHAPLKFWSNERLQYRYTESGDIECLGVVCDSKADELAFEKVVPAKKKKLIEKIGQHIKKEKRRSTRAQSRSYIEKGIPVIDAETKEEVYVNAVIPFDNILWRSPKSDSLAKRFEIGKSYMMDNAAYGFLRVEPMQTKPMQYLPGYDAVFVVITGKVEAVIHRTPIIVSEKDTFFVPKGNPYSVTNLLDSVALLNFMATNNSYLDELKKTE